MIWLLFVCLGNISCAQEELIGHIALHRSEELYKPSILLPCSHMSEPTIVKGPSSFVIFHIPPYKRLMFNLKPFEEYCLYPSNNKSLATDAAVYDTCAKEEYRIEDVHFLRSCVRDLRVSRIQLQHLFGTLETTINNVPHGISILDKKVWERQEMEFIRSKETLCDLRSYAQSFYKAFQDENYVKMKKLVAEQMDEELKKTTHAYERIRYKIFLQFIIANMFISMGYIMPVFNMDLSGNLLLRACQLYGGYQLYQLCSAHKKFSDLYQNYVPELFF